MIYDLSKLTKENDYPIIKPVFIQQPKTLWQKIKKFFSYRRKFKLVFEFVLWSERLGEYIYHPAEFIFDGASVPKILNSLYGPTGILFLGSIPHDLGYRYNGLLLIDQNTGEVYMKYFSKHTIDNVFKDFCAQESGLPAASSVAKGTLSAVGFFAWNSHRKHKNNINIDFPELSITRFSVEVPNE